MIKCIQIQDACMDDELAEMEEFTIKEGHMIAHELDLENFFVEIKGNVMMIGHDDGVFIYVKQD